jgi:hypothetical protein
VNTPKLKDFGKDAAAMQGATLGSRGEYFKEEVKDIVLSYRDSNEEIG